ncbi:MAG: extracellular solute-binding protein [Cyanobacteria bacterium P01_G01_bin.54]
MKVSRRTFVAGGTALTALILGNLPRRATAQTGGLNLYSSRHYDTDERLYSSFGEVNRIEGKATELIARIESEGERSPADVLLTVDAGNLWFADQAGLFQPVDSTRLNRRIPENYRHNKGHWFGFSTRARAVYYRKGEVELPANFSYEDLADSEWAGKVLIRSSSNIYNKSLIASLIANHGEPLMKDWLAAFMGNMARPPQGNDTAQLKACAAGEGDLAVANSYYYARLIKAGANGDREAQDVVDKVGIFFPNQEGQYDRGTHVNISGGGVLATSPNPEAAVRFLEHLASTASQRWFADGNNEYPVVAGVDLSATLESMGDFKRDTATPVQAYGEHQQAAVRLMDQVGWA